jgi:hypothetical protein
MSNSKQTSAKIKSLQRFGYLLSTIVCGILAYTTLTGDLQNHIHFAGIPNEIGFFIMASMLTVISAICTCTE